MFGKKKTTTPRVSKRSGRSSVVTAPCGCRWVNGMHVHAYREHLRLLGD
jgi:hypothetical protein